ncbi:fatty acid desaturase [Candidatus Berkelbacteria bacterium]|nr:fatty acid desaturase [Candidatus Berkelbacteria bacterium]
MEKRYQQLILAEIRQRYPGLNILKPLPYRLLWLPPSLLVVGGLWWLVVHCHWSIGIVFAVGLGVSYASIGFFGHETMHGAMTSSKSAQHVIGSICFAPFCVASILWQWWHVDTHHAFTQVHDRDPDARGRIEEYQSNPVLRFIVWLIPPGRWWTFFPFMGCWFTIHSTIMAIRCLRTEPKKRLSVVLGSVLPISVWLLMSYCFGWRFLIFGFLLPVYVANGILMSFISSNHFLNRQVTVNAMDPVDTALTVTVPWIVRVLMHNFDRHTAHHVFDRMSGKYAPLVTNIIRGLWPKQYHEMSLWRAMIELYRAPRVFVDDLTMINPPTGTTRPVLGYE